jgi:DNA-binding response OmpR family regulator/DNA-binding CsgD family transcriptional regulator
MNTARSVPLAPSRPAAADAVAAPLPLLPGVPGVVLVVDDAPDTVRMLCAALAEEGYTVLVATGGEEALSRFELAVPDAVLMDAVMPGLDGFAACRRIKAEPAWAHVPVIFMTGLTETEDIVQGFAAGGTDYVVKPLRVAEVLARLATHVRQAQAVDVGGLGTVLLDGQGRVAWQSPRAGAWLREGRAGEQPASWLAQAAARCEALAAQGEAAEVRRPGSAPGEPALVVRHLGAAGLNERMLVLRLDAGEPPAGDARRLDSAALTPRETEVLSWVAKGKTNRDIGEILGMSPRTVNKHLEHVFEKLGVETRAAAAALASRGMGGT